MSELTNEPGELSQAEQAEVLTRAAEAAVAQNPLDIYNRLVTWYVHRPHLHIPAFAACLLLLLAGLFYALGWAPGETGYERYTPIHWLIGLASLLIFAFVARYSAFSFDAAEVAAGTFERATLKPWVQHVIVVFTIAALIIEVYLLLFVHGHTISAWSRDITLFRPWAYWATGVLTGFLIGALVDVQVPQLVRLMMAVWVATLAHIFWWITPKLAV